LAGCKSSLIRGFCGLRMTKQSHEYAGRFSFLALVTSVSVQ